jgi:hypothetical protein
MLSNNFGIYIDMLKRNKIAIEKNLQMVLTVFWKKSHGPHLCQLATESETT